jgi:hypothetical protein
MLNLKKIPIATPGLTTATPRLIGKSLALRLTEFSFKHSKADSLTLRVGESVSHRLDDLPSQRVADSPTYRVGELLTRQVGESFFDYEYLLEFEAKSGTAHKVV